MSDHVYHRLTCFAGVNVMKIDQNKSKCIFAFLLLTNLSLLNKVVIEISISTNDRRNFHLLDEISKQVPLTDTESKSKSLSLNTQSSKELKLKWISQKLNKITN